MFAGIIYTLTQKSFDFLPGAVFDEVHLAIEVEWGDWYIDYIDVSEEHPGTKTRSFTRGDWIYDQMIKEIYKDPALMGDISFMSRQAWVEGAY